MSDIKDLPISSLDEPLSAALRKVVGNSTRAGTKVLHQPAYILHSHSYSETSLVLDVFTRGQGRLLIVAKGAKRPYTRWRASIFQTFQTLSISFSGKAMVRTLLDAEWVGGIPMLQGAAMISGYYMNEWLQRGLAHADAHEALFDAYQQSLAALSLHAHTAMEQAQVLRQFEWVLLRELGFGLDFSGLNLTDQPEKMFQWNLLEQRWLSDSSLTQDDSSHVVGVCAQTILDIQAQNFTQAKTQNEARRLFRSMLAQHILDKPLLTRQVARELQLLQLLQSKENKENKESQA